MTSYSSPIPTFPDIIFSVHIKPQETQPTTGVVNRALVHGGFEQFLLVPSYLMWCAIDDGKLGGFEQFPLFPDYHLIWLAIDGG